jgi:tetratricopeptide (TPR) repeat protein
VPAALGVPPDVGERHAQAWRRLQGGDSRRAGDEFTAILSRRADFYPSETGLAYVHLAERRFQAAVDRFRAALVRDPQYLSAWHGLVDAELGLGRDAEATAALERILEIDPTREAARTRLDVLRLKRQIASMEPQRPAEPPARPPDDPAAGAAPKDLRSLAGAATVTRGELAAIIATELERVVLRAPRQIPVIVTDIRGHWAESAILTVTRLGVMEVLPNHTFQPSQPVRRDRLAAIVSALLELAATDKPGDLALWTTARPLFADLPPSHLFYRQVAMAVSAGAMRASDDGRFQPAAPASGADVVQAVHRIDRLAGR